MNLSLVNNSEHILFGYVRGKHRRTLLMTMVYGLLLIIVASFYFRESRSSFRSTSNNNMVAFNIEGNGMARRTYDYSGMTKRHRDDVPKFVLGIFSTNTPKGAKRRQLIRDTYLTVNRVDNLRDPRICSLLLYEKEGMKNDDCVILYVFVMGGILDDNNSPDDMNNNNNERSILTDHFQTNQNMILEKEEEEGDVIYLNIKENKHEGKTPTFFKWAAHRNGPCQNPRLVCAHYVAKAEDDTMIYMPAFLDKIVYQLPPIPYNNRIYGGKKTDWYECGMTDYCKSAISQGYMKGALYFLSPDLARDITGDNNDDGEPRKFYKQKEDFDMGIWIFKNVKKTLTSVTMVTTGLNDFIWVPHPVTDHKEWTKLWNTYEDGGVPYILESQGR